MLHICTYKRGNVQSCTCITHTYAIYGIIYGNSNQQHAYYTRMHIISISMQYAVLCTVTVSSNSGDANRATHIQE